MTESVISKIINNHHVNELKKTSLNKCFSWHLNITFQWIVQSVAIIYQKVKQMNLEKKTNVLKKYIYNS